MIVAGPEGPNGVDREHIDADRISLLVSNGQNGFRRHGQDVLARYQRPAAIQNDYFRVLGSEDFDGGTAED